jgi:hypothetical protein
MDAAEPTAETQPAEPVHQWLTIQEVAERLRYSPRTIQRYIARGFFDPVLRTDHSVRISQESVARFERNHLGGVQDA